MTHSQIALPFPFGGYRAGSAPTQTITNRDFTGQKENMELGLLYYGARFYVPGLGRFASADTIIPNPADPQSYNRYSYVRNRPLNRIDPSGHADCTMLGDLSDTMACNSINDRPVIPGDSMVVFTGTWSYTDEDDNVVDETWKQADIQQAAVVLGRQFARILNELYPGWNLTPSEAFLLVYGGAVSFNHMGREANNGIRGFTNDANSIDVYGGRMAFPVHWAIHELGHAFNHAIGGVGDDMLTHERAQGMPIPIRTGYSEDDQFGFAGTHSPSLHWQQSTQGFDDGEEFADMMVGWAYNEWELKDGIHPWYSTDWSIAGQARSDFMTNNMANLLSLAIDN